VNIFVAILGLGLLVLVHEAGHFFTARAVGMTPRRFYVGFPPPLVRVRRKGIEYGIGAIPLGGYVKIPGMHRPAPSDLDTYLGPALAEAPHLLAPLEHVKRRLAKGDMDGARELLPALEHALEAASISPQADKLARKGLTELQDGLGTDAYWRQKTWRKVSVIFAGPGTNFLFAIVLFTALFVAGSGGYRLGFSLGTSSEPVVDAVRSDRPAGRMGLEPGDRIVAVNGVSVERAEDVPPLIERSRGRPITVTVRRNGQRVQLGPARPQAEPRLSLPTAAWHSVRLTGVITKEIGASLTRLVRGERKEVSSPVGIVEGSSEALEQGAQTYFWVLGLLSLSLALLNLLPLLPLDGGHIAFSIIEGIRGRAVGREVYERVSAVGIALVLLLFFIGLSNDLGNLGN
jgi:regulator of sigma E protease